MASHSPRAQRHSSKTIGMQGVPIDWQTNIERWTLVLRTADRAEGTIKTRTGHIAQLARWLRRKPLTGVTAEDVIEFTGSHEWSRAYRRSMYVSLRQFFRWAHGCAVVDVDPALNLPTIQPSKRQRQPASEDAVWAAWSKASARELLMLSLAIGYGLRRSEVAQAHRDHVLRDLAGWILLVKGKGGKERLVPIEDHLAAALLRAGDETGWIFPGDIDGHLSPRWVGTLVSRLLPGAFTMHSLRTRFAVVTHNQTRNIRVVQELLGHENLNTTQQYLPVDLFEIRHELRKATLALQPSPQSSRVRYEHPPAPIPFPPDHRHAVSIEP